VLNHTVHRKAFVISMYWVEARRRAHFTVAEVIIKRISQSFP